MLFIDSDGNKLTDFPSNCFRLSAKRELKSFNDGPNGLFDVKAKALREISRRESSKREENRNNVENRIRIRRKTWNRIERHRSISVQIRSDVRKKKSA